MFIEAIPCLGIVSGDDIAELANEGFINLEDDSWFSAFLDLDEDAFSIAEKFEPLQWFIDEPFVP